MPPDIPVVIVSYQRVLGDLLDRTQRFPKAVRFTFATRIDNLGLDVLDHLVQARWSTATAKAAHLRDADLCLARLRVLLRLCHDRRYLDSGSAQSIAPFTPGPSPRPMRAGAPGASSPGWPRPTRTGSESPTHRPEELAVDTARDMRTDVPSGVTPA